MEDWSGRHEYTEENVKKYVPTSGGVYRLIYKASDDSYKVFYVGKSDNLERRLLEHLSDLETDECIKRHLKSYYCYCRYLKVATQTDRDSIEQQQISEYTPSCNNVYKNSYR